MPAENNGASTDEIDAIEDGKIFDYITGKPVAENDKEHVRQRIARALFHEYGISVDDMEPDLKVKVDGYNKKIDIAIFEPGSEHTPENVRRLVVCQKELKLGDTDPPQYSLREVWRAQIPGGLPHQGLAGAAAFCRKPA